MNLFGRNKPKLESHTWQAWLILVPVLVLALAGLHALRQDRRLVESEARDRARRLANDWLRSISEEWDATEARATNRSPDALSRSEPSDGYFFQLDRMGHLLVPPDYSPVPDPEPFNFGALTPDQLQRWQAARQIELQSNDSLEIAEAFRLFADAQLSPEFEAWGRFGAACISRELAERKPPRPSRTSRQLFRSGHRERAPLQSFGGTASAEARQVPPKPCRSFVPTPSIAPRC